jgi:hypothetical protein
MEDQHLEVMKVSLVISIVASLARVKTVGMLIKNDLDRLIIMKMTLTTLASIRLMK